MGDRAGGAVLRGLFTAGGLLGLWEALVRLLAVPAFVLPPPSRVAVTLVERAGEIAPHALVTAAEIVIGLVAGAGVGVALALAMAGSAVARRWLQPLVLIAPAIPVFAIAPLLVLWFGFGLASKVVMAGLIVFFPVCAAFFDGLTRTDAGLIDLARLNRASAASTLFVIRVPAALPDLAAGIRVGAGVAPIGAVVGEWVGSAAGLGFLMLHANARMQTDLVFAALAVLVAFALPFWFLIDAGLKRLVPWAGIEN